MDTNEPAPHPNGDRLSVSEAAEMLGIHQNTLRARLKKGRYPHEQVLTPYGPAYSIPRAAVEADLAAALQAPHSEPGGSNGGSPQAMVLSPLLSLTEVMEGALAPLVDELARSRAEAADAHERAGRAEGEKDALRTRALAAEEQARRMDAHAAALERALAEREQRRPWWKLW